MPSPAFSLSELVLLPDLLAQVDYGGYLSWWKALLFVLIFLVWVRLLLWIDKDTVAARMPREAINSGLWVLLAGAMVLAVFIPTFIVAFTLFVALFAVSIGGYLIWRNQVVGLSDIPEDFNTWAKNLFKSKKQKRFEKKDETVAEGMVTLMDARGNPPPTPDQDDPIRPAYEAAHRLLLDPLYKGAERIVIANAGERYGTKYRVDGVDYPGIAIESDTASLTIDYIKTLAGLEVNERRRFQKGNLKARTAKGSNEIEVQTSGTRTGETMVMEIDRKTRYRERATALGMSSQQREVLTDVVADNQGLVLAAAPAGGGLTALLYGLVQEHDAFVQHIITVERSPERELEGTTQNTLPTGADPAEEAKQISWIADQLPDVLMAAGIESRDGARQVVRLASEERKRAYFGLRATDVADAVARWRQLTGDDKTAFSQLQLVVVGRTLRKLCDACKDAYEPSDAALAKMGVPKGKVRTLYRARTEPVLDQRGNPVICDFCGGLGYQGRIGVFEMLRVDGDVRRALAKDASPANVKALLRAQKMPTLNEAAVRTVISGTTDLQEVQRVMTAQQSPPRRPAPARKAG